MIYAAFITENILSEFNMAYTPCAQSIAQNIVQNCDAPLVGGYTGRAVLIPAGSAYSVTQDAENPRMLVSITPAQSTAVVIDNLAVVAPFNGSSTAASADNGIRQYTKTIAFRIPSRGAGVSKNIVEPLSNGEGYLAVVEKKDNNGADGKYEVIGFQQALKVNEDGIQRTEDENGGAILATMSCVEGWFEATLVGAKEGTPGAYTLAGAKAAFASLVAAAI